MFFLSYIIAGWDRIKKVEWDAISISIWDAIQQLISGFKWDGVVLLKKKRKTLLKPVFGLTGFIAKGPFRLS